MDNIKFGEKGEAIADDAATAMDHCLAFSKTEEALAQRLRRLAKKDKLVAMKSRRDQKWYIADFNNYLQSSEHGMTLEEALYWITDGAWSNE